MIDRNVVEEYLSLVDFNILDKNRFELTDINKTDKQKFSELENQRIG